MPTRKPSPPARRHPDSWTVAEEYVHKGRHLEPGTEFSVQGESGRFRFHHHVVTPSGEWVSCHGGKEGHEAWRSFDPARIKTVHRIARTRKGA